MLLDAEGSKYFLFLDDGARFDGDEPPGCKVARPAFARFSRHLGLMGGRAVERTINGLGFPHGKFRRNGLALLPINWKSVTASALTTVVIDGSTAGHTQ